MSKGYVYILSNVSMPGLVKIGKTTRQPNQRASELYQTGVPTPFVVAECMFCPDCDTLERDLHAHFAANRVTPDREFFEVDVAVARDALEEFQRSQVEDWLEEFIPDSVIVHDSAHVDLGGLELSVLDALSAAGVQPPDVPNILYYINGTEIQPAILRWKQAVERRRIKNEAREANLKVVGDQ